MEVMSNARKLRHADKIFSCISVGHDLTAKEKQVVKETLERARQPNAQQDNGDDTDLGNWAYRVVGPHRKLRVFRYNKKD